MKISKILRNAANRRLWDGSSPRNDPPWEYSCDAVFAHSNLHWKDETKTRRFLSDLGVNTMGMLQFREFKDIQDRQAARYSWLMFASMYAKELGI